jgi:hypothetical protein
MMMECGVCLSVSIAVSSRLYSRYVLEVTYVCEGSAGIHGGYVQHHERAAEQLWMVLNSGYNHRTGACVQNQAIGIIWSCQLGYAQHIAAVVHLFLIFIL